MSLPLGNLQAKTAPVIPAYMEMTGAAFLDVGYLFPRERLMLQALRSRVWSSPIPQPVVLMAKYFLPSPTNDSCS